MESLRVLIEALIAEGVLEREVTETSRKIVDALKLKLSKTGGFVRQFKLKFPVPQSVDARSIEVDVRRGMAEDVPSVGGDSRYNKDYPERNIVRIWIEVPKGWSDFSFMLSQLSIVIPDLKDMLRHEFEHFTQTPKEWAQMRKQNLKTPKGVENYFMDPREVKAHVMGMYKLAKTSKKDLGRVFLDRNKEVYGFMRSAGADGLRSSAVARSVLRAWREYARGRLPSARL